MVTDSGAFEAFKLTMMDDGAESKPNIVSKSSADLILVGVFS
jgi:hypothetical protein